MQREIVELSQANIPNDLIGATHIFIGSDGQPYVFFIQSTQANDPSDAVWQIGFGSLQEPQIKKRVDAIINYLTTAGEPQVQKAFEQLATNYPR